MHLLISELFDLFDNTTHFDYTSAYCRLTLCFKPALSVKLICLQGWGLLPKPFNTPSQDSQT